MKIRFPSDRRASWRQRFLAIARQVESAGERAQDLSSTTGLRRPRAQGSGSFGRIRTDAAAH
jgi:hypothetical protein